MVFRRCYRGRVSLLPSVAGATAKLRFLLPVLPWTLAAVQFQLRPSGAAVISVFSGMHSRGGDFFLDFLRLRGVRTWSVGATHVKIRKATCGGHVLLWTRVDCRIRGIGSRDPPGDAQHGPSVAMSSAAAAEKSSPPASAIVANTTTRGYHILKIDGYSLTKGTPTGEALDSCQFTTCGYRWRIRYHPNGDRSESAEYISLFLVLDETAIKKVETKLNIRFVDSAEEQPSPTSLQVANFDSLIRSWGHHKFIKREDLEKSKHLVDDSFTVRCDIAVINEFRAEEMPAPKFVSVPPSDLNQHLGDLLATGEGADVVFEVAGETFAAHRWLLASRSSVFKAELFGSMKESGAADAIRIDDMEAQVFRALLHFAYTDSFWLPATEEKEIEAMCQHLLVAADRYSFERLKLVCEEKLCKYIDVSTVGTIMALAEQHHCQGLKKACFHFLSSPPNLTAAAATEGFQHLSRSCPFCYDRVGFHVIKRSLGLIP